MREDASKPFFEYHIPYTNAGWTAWQDVEANGQLFEDTLRECKHVRSKLGQRWEPLDDLRPCKRLQACGPRQFGDVDKLIKIVGHGFYCAEIDGEAPVLFYAAFVGTEVWAAVLQCTGNRCFVWDLEILLSSTMFPLSDAFASVGVKAASRIVRFTVAIMQFLRLEGSRVFWHVASCEVPKLLPRKPGARIDEGASDSDLEDSDVDSVYSVAESGVEQEDDGEEDEGGETGGDNAELGSAGDARAVESAERAPSGTWVVQGDEYFTVTNTPGYDDCKIRIKTKWCKPHLLGVKDMSKNFRFDEYDFDVDLCYLMARTWMLWRFSADGFAKKTPFRQKWLAQETESVRKDLLARRAPAGGVGNANADAFVKEFCPAVLP